MDKTAYQRAHRRMVRDTFSPGWTPAHRASKGYKTKLAHRAETAQDNHVYTQGQHGRKLSNDSHSWRGRRKTERPLTHRQRGILDYTLYKMVQDDDAPMLRPGQMTNVLVIKVRRIQ